MAICSSRFPGEPHRSLVKALCYLTRSVEGNHKSVDKISVDLRFLAANRKDREASGTHALEVREGLVIIVRFHGRGGNGDGLNVRSFDRNHPILVLQNPSDQEELFSIDD